MKRTLIFLIGLILAGTLAYFLAYYVYTLNHPKLETAEPMILQKSVPLLNEDKGAGQEEYYLAKIEQDMLMIYKMPGEILYDSVKLSSLHFTENQQPELSKGIIFQNLTEVFEFLENSMS